MFKLAKYGRIGPFASKFVSESEESNDYLHHSRVDTISLEEIKKFDENAIISFHNLTLGELASIKQKT